MNYRRAFAVYALLLAPLVYAAEPVRAPLPLRAPVQDKNFYVLSVLERSAAKTIEADAELKAVLSVKRDVLRTCGSDIDCLMSGMRFSDDEVSKVAGVLRRLELREIEQELRRSGTYGEKSVDAAWTDAARGINNVIDIYGSGKAPRYPDIDSISFDVKSKSYAQLIQTLAANLDEQSAGLKLFFQPSLRFALYLLQINHRDEAGRHEPLESKDNAAVVRRIGSIRWRDFPYTMIIVPGSGPDRLTWSNSPVSRLRCEIAARRYKEGKAPLILVSGGYVHPKQTPYCEAIEMKKSLIEDYGVPAEAILVDPHARHTTTNLRNASRLIYRYGIPLDRKALVTTDTFQSTYIEGADFAKRCDEQLGYQPGKIVGRVSKFDLEMLPRVESLRIDPNDPLDP